MRSRKDEEGGGGCDECTLLAMATCLGLAWVLLWCWRWLLSMAQVPEPVLGVHLHSLDAGATAMYTHGNHTRGLTHTHVFTHTHVHVCALWG